MKKAERFSIYRHSFVYGNNLIVTKQFIVLNHADGTRTFTDFHRYVENPNKKVKGDIKIEVPPFLLFRLYFLKLDQPFRV